MNLLVAIAFILVAFGAILLAYRLLGKVGLYAITPIVLIYANIQVNILVEIAGVTTTLGNVLYGCTFLITDILSEHHGKKAAHKAIIIGFFAQLLPIAFIYLTYQYTPSADDAAFPYFLGMFALVPRITLAGLAAFAVSQFIDVRIFHKLKAVTGGKKLWLRNNLSTCTSQLIDTAIFTFGAFLGVFEFPILISILLTTYIFKLLISLADTPFVYLSGLIKPKEETV